MPKMWTKSRNSVRFTYYLYILNEKKPSGFRVRKKYRYFFRVRCVGTRYCIFASFLCWRATFTFFSSTKWSNLFNKSYFRPLTMLSTRDLTEILKATIIQVRFERRIPCPFRFVYRTADISPLRLRYMYVKCNLFLWKDKLMNCF